MADQKRNQKQQNKRGGEQSVGQSVTTTQATRLAQVCRAAVSAPLTSREGLFWGRREASVIRECESWADLHAGRER